MPAWPTTGPLVDQHGRTVEKLRISVTDRCNFRCMYCMPEDVSWLPSEAILDFDEIQRVSKIAASIGVTQIRLTGGEPLMRPGVADLVARLTQVSGIEKVAMTTNAFYLDEQKARALRRAGLKGVNISLDSLDRQRFEKLVRRDYLERVMEGIATAIRVGLEPVKINVVAMNGVNDDEVVQFLRWSMERPVVVRFIEFMPLDGDNIWERNMVLTAEEILERAHALGPVEPVNNDPTEPARRYRFAGGEGEFGIIASVSEPFCTHCNRVRLTADGKLRNCLFALEEYDLKPLLRGTVGDDELEQAIREAIWDKWEGHLINQDGFERPDRSMYSIGG